MRDSAVTRQCTVATLSHGNPTRICRAPSSCTISMDLVPRATPRIHERLHGYSWGRLACIGTVGAGLPSEFLRVTDAVLK